MKLKQVVGGYVLAFGFWGSQAQAQAGVVHGAVDPAIAPAVTPPSDAEPAPSTVPPTVEAPSTTPVPAPAPAPAPAPPASSVPPAPLPPPAVPSGPATGAPLALGASVPSADAPTPRPTSKLPIRAQRKLALLGEVGWNTVGGWGLAMTYNAHPHLALDVAGGFSMTGWKAGLRGRYNLLKGPFTPFIGAGLSLSTGLDGARIGGERQRDRGDRGEFDFDPSEEARYDVEQSAFAQAVVGFELIHRHGFTMQAAAGYSRLLNQNNYAFVAGKRDDDLASALFGSGPVVSLAFGYAFN